MLKNDNILLRKLEPQDLPLLYLWENDSDSWGDSDTHNPLSQKDLRDYIESSTGDIYRDGQLRLIIETNIKSVSGEKPLPLTLGCIDLFDFDPQNKKAAVGIYIVPEERSRGIGRQAVRLLEEYAFEFLKINMLYIFISEHNKPSISLFSSLGWQHVATISAWLNTGGAVLMQKLNNICM